MEVVADPMDSIGQCQGLKVEPAEAEGDELDKPIKEEPEGEGQERQEDAIVISWDQEDQDESISMDQEQDPDHDVREHENGERGEENNVHNNDSNQRVEAVEENSNPKVASDDSGSGSNGSTDASARSGQKPELSFIEEEDKVWQRLEYVKAREWDYILSLRKLREVRNSKLKRQVEIEGRKGGEEGIGESKAVRTATSDSALWSAFGSRLEAETLYTVKLLDKKLEELKQEVYGSFDPLRGAMAAGNGADAGAGDFAASNFLKKLVTTKNLNAAGRPITPRPVGKADRTGDSESSQPKKTKKSISYHLFPRLVSIPDKNYTELLTKVCSQAEKLDKGPAGGGSPNSKGSSSIEVTKPQPVAKSSKSVPLLPTKSHSATTLAKLLSSNGPTSGSWSAAAEDSPAIPKSATNSEKNLSLANLLASSKGRDEIFPSKKKEKPLEKEKVCQGCRTNTAQFVCAGCGNQWYCSRDCQVDAWDEHSEVCSDKDSVGS